MQSLRVEIADSLPALLALEDQLAALAAAAGAGAYDRPGFFLPWARAAVATGQRPACLCLWRGPDLAGFVPVFRRRDWKAALAWRGGPPLFGSSAGLRSAVCAAGERSGADRGNGAGAGTDAVA